MTFSFMAIVAHTRASPSVRVLPAVPCAEVRLRHCRLEGLLIADRRPLKLPRGESDFGGIANALGTFGHY